MSRYVTNVPVPVPQPHLPDIQAVESPMNRTGTGFSDTNFSFLDHNHANSNAEPMDVVRLPEQQSSSAYRPWPSTHPNSSILNSIPLPQQKIISKSGVAVPIAITPPLDYALLLLSLAEDYFAIAHGEGSLAGLRQGKGRMQTYYGLIATGLGCLEAVLKVNLPAEGHFNRADLNISSVSDCSPGWRRRCVYDMLRFYMTKRKM